MLPIGLNQSDMSKLRGIVNSAMSRGVGSIGSFSPFALLGSLGSGLMTNITNAILNKQNNRAQQAESEKAYQRSLPSNQVNNLMNAGMSRAGALSALTGGGTYIPAPQTATEIDTSTIQSVLGSVAQQEMQAKHAERLADKQIAAQAKEGAAERENAKEIARIQADTSKYSADKNYDIAIKRYSLDKKIADQLTPKQVAQLDSIIAKNNADVRLTNTQERDLAYRIAEYQSSEYKSVRDAKNLLEGLQADFNVKITNKSFEEYLAENYNYNEQTGDYELKKWISNANRTQNVARVVWNTIFEILPVNMLLETLGGTVENVRAIKLLSKIK